jgi:hypothetical protein
MDRNEGPLTALTIALHGGLHLAIMMGRYECHHISLSMALNRGLYLAIIKDRYE